MSLVLTDEEKELIVEGLCMKKNCIETGDAMLSAVDCQNMKKIEKIRVLDIPRHRLIVHIAELIDKVNQSHVSS